MAAGFRDLLSLVLRWWSAPSTAPPVTGPVDLSISLRLAPALRIDLDDI